MVSRPRRGDILSKVTGQVLFACQNLDKVTMLRYLKTFSETTLMVCELSDSRGNGIY